MQLAKASCLRRFQHSIRKQVRRCNNGKMHLPPWTAAGMTGETVSTSPVEPFLVDQAADRLT